jgi:cell division protein YceG involved in septum cleavage
MNRTAERMMEGNAYYQMNRKRIWMVGSLMLVAMLLFSVFFITKTVTAQRVEERTKQVACVEIQKGDTLWSIASEYMTEEYDDMNEYIEEIKNSNRMLSDEIHAGNYIIVPYYADATRVAFAQ